MPIQQGTRSCPVCGAITTIQVSEDGGATWRGPDNEAKHAEWHARQDGLIKGLHDALSELGGAVMELGGIEP